MPSRRTASKCRARNRAYVHRPARLSAETCNWDRWTFSRPERGVDHAGSGDAGAPCWFPHRFVDEDQSEVRSVSRRREAMAALDRVISLMAGHVRASIRCGSRSCPPARCWSQAGAPAPVRQSSGRSRARLNPGRRESDDGRVGGQPNIIHTGTTDFRNELSVTLASYRPGRDAAMARDPKMSCRHEQMIQAAPTEKGRSGSGYNA
jgi:hypothetical protein